MSLGTMEIGLSVNHINVTLDSPLYGRLYTHIMLKIGGDLVVQNQCIFQAQ